MVTKSHKSEAWSFHGALSPLPDSTVLHFSDNVDSWGMDLAVFGGPIWGALSKELYCFGSIVGAPHFWKSRNIEVVCEILLLGPSRLF